MKKWSKKQKLKIVQIAYKIFQDETDRALLCYCLSRAAKKLKLLHTASMAQVLKITLYQFPELLVYKPKAEPKEGIWFPRDIHGYTKRKEILKQLYFDISQQPDPPNLFQRLIKKKIKSWM